MFRVREAVRLVWLRGARFLPRIVDHGRRGQGDGDVTSLGEHAVSFECERSWRVFPPGDCVRRRRRMAYRMSRLRTVPGRRWPMSGNRSTVSGTLAAHGAGADRAPMRMSRGASKRVCVLG